MKSIYFLTLTVIEWIDIFTNEDYLRVLSDSMNYCIDNKGLVVNGYVFMTNHIHLLTDAQESINLDDIISDFKRYSTKKIINLVKTDNRSYIIRLLYKSYKKKEENRLQIWQPNNWPEVVENQKFYNQKLDYIHNNPVLQGFVNDPCKWRYSSARDYYSKEEGSIKITIE